MKKFLLLAVTAMISIVANAWTVSFTNPDNWTKVNAYAWSGSGTQTANWPGTAMTKTGDVWTLTMEGAVPENIIFNDGSAQTGDLKFVDGATYDKLGVVGAELITYSVYFDNSKTNWNNVYFYTFSPEVCGSWPGVELQKNSDGLYEWNYEATSEPSFGGIIFTNNQGAQTANLTFENNATYDINGKVGAELHSYTVYFDNSKSNWDKVCVYTFSPELAGSWPGTELTANSDGLYEWTIESTTEPTVGGIIFNNNNGSQTDNLTYEAGATYNVNGKVVGGDVETKIYLAGVITDWSTTDVAYKFTEVEDGIYRLSVPTLSGDFKLVVNGNWLGYTEAPLVSGEPYVLYDPGYGQCILASDPAEDVVLTYTEATKTLVVTYNTGKLEVPAAVYVFGTLESGKWAPQDAVEMNKEEGIFTIKGLKVQTEYGSAGAYIAFTSVKDADWDVVNANRYGAKSANLEVAFGTPVEFIFKTENNFVVVPTAPNENGVFTVDIVMDFDNQVVTFTEVSEEQVEYPELFLIAYEGEPQLSFADGVYSIVLPNITEDGWSIGNLEDMNVIAIKEDTEIKENNYFDVYYVSYNTLFEGDWLSTTDFTTDNKVKISLIGDVDAFVPNSMKPIKMMIDTTVGVEEIEANEAGAVYFNLQGVRVANPEKGMFIKVQGDKATKVAL